MGCAGSSLQGDPQTIHIIWSQTIVIQTSMHIRKAAYWFDVQVWKGRVAKKDGKKEAEMRKGHIFQECLCILKMLKICRSSTMHCVHCLTRRERLRLTGKNPAVFLDTRIFIKCILQDVKVLPLIIIHFMHPHASRSTPLTPKLQDQVGKPPSEFSNKNIFINVHL